MSEGSWFDRFSGRLVLVLPDNKFSPAIKGGRSLWGLQRDLGYVTGDPRSEERIVVPAGFVTDLASIPRWCWILLPPDGPWVKAAIVHDFLYATEGSGHWKRRNDGRSRAGTYTRAEADGIFLEALQNRGVGLLKRLVLWAAVRIGGGGGWGSGDSRQPASTDAEAFIRDA